MEKRALDGKKVLITRSREQSKGMKQSVLAFGGQPILAPVMAFERMSLSEKEQERFLKEVGNSNWIIFTSANSVTFFFDYIDPREVSQIKIAAVGMATKEVLKGYGLVADFIPDRYTADAFAANFIERQPSGQSVFLPQGQLAKPNLKNQLIDAGFRVTTVPVYSTVINRGSQALLIKLIEEKALDVVTFTSPSAVNFFIELVNGSDWEYLLKDTVIACIGSVTAEYVETRGLMPTVVPEEFTSQKLIEAVTHYYMEESL